MLFSQFLDDCGLVKTLAQEIPRSKVVDEDFGKHFSQKQDAYKSKLIKRLGSSRGRNMENTIRQLLWGSCKFDHLGNFRIRFHATRTDSRDCYFCGLLSNWVIPCAKKTILVW